MRELYSLCVRVAEIAPTPMSAPPPSPQNAITLIGSAFILPLRMSALRPAAVPSAAEPDEPDRKSTRLNSSHTVISYAVFCLKKKTAPADEHPSYAAAACVHRRGGPR